MRSEALEAAVTAPTTLLLRRPMLDAARTIHGHVLQDPSPGGETLEAVLAQGDALHLAERRLLFVRATPGLLASPVLEIVAPENLILQVATPPGDEPAEIAWLQEHMKLLRERGFRFAFGRSALRRAYTGWLPLASYVRVDAAGLDATPLPALLSFVRAHTNAQPIAWHVNDAARFEQLRDMGFPLFVGDWFAKPSPVPAGTMRPAIATVTRILALLQRDCDIDEIEPVLKQDPALAVNLLRMINSADIGLPCAVTSLRHAAMMLGRKRLFRWATMLLTLARATSAAPAAVSAAMVRARLMELLAAELLPAEDCDNAFVVGLFSLLDVMLDMPLHHALDSIALPDNVADALLRRTGLFAPFLALTEACESGDEATFATAALQLTLSNHQINWAHLQALAWAEDLLAA